MQSEYDTLSWLAYKTELCAFISSKQFGITLIKDPNACQHLWLINCSSPVSQESRMI